jgi:hypothetical protein
MKYVEKITSMVVDFAKGHVKAVDYALGIKALKYSILVLAVHIALQK